MIQWQTFRRRASVRAAIFWCLAILLVFVPFWSLSVGAVRIDPDSISQFIGDRLAAELNLDARSSLDYSQRETLRDQTLLLDIRLPRVLLGGLIGAALAVAGVALQGVFRNNLADPGLIGVASGAAVGAVTAISGGWVLAGDARLAQILAAFVFGLATTALVYRLSYRQQYTDSTTLLLLGLAVNAIASSYVGMVTFTAGQAVTGDIIFWTLGSLAGVFWQDVRAILPFLALALVGLPFLAQQLNLLALGESEARHLGVPVERLRGLTLLLASLLVGLAVALGGMIGFVGLVIPNLMRGLFGPDHRILIPSSVVGGAIFVMGADLFARQIAIPTEIPLGVVTTLIGGPFFLGLILFYRRA